MKNKRKRNLLEVRNGLVHADCAGGDDHTLCGVTAETACDEIPFDYDRDEDEFSDDPLMIWTSQKITCSDCISTIKHCCKLGLKSIDKDAENCYEAF
jgi:hypothetical protein